MYYSMRFGQIRGRILYMLQHLGRKDDSGRLIAEWDLTCIRFKINIGKLMHDADWKVIDMAGVLGFAASALQLFQQASAPKVPVRLRKPFFGLMQGLIALTDRLYTPTGRLRNAAVFVICAQP